MVTIKCPYCSHEFEDDPEGYEEYDVECPECNEEIEVYIECIPSATVCKIKYDKCPRCENEKRDNEIKNVHKNFKEGKVQICEECHAELVTYKRLKVNVYERENIKKEN